MISYSGWKLFCTSTPRPFEGRSLICPIEAITTKSLPRYLLIVFALAGDSTMTRFLVITYSIRVTDRYLFDDRGLLPNHLQKVFGSGNENNTKYALNTKQGTKASILLAITHNRGRVYVSVPSRCAALIARMSYILRTKHIPGSALTNSRISKLSSALVRWVIESLVPSASVSIC